MTPGTNSEGELLPSVTVIGTDALLAALPATPVQLAHACHAAGYSGAYPVSWGDELVAAGCVRRVALRGSDPAIMCSCPFVADALLSVGSDLARFLVPLVSPPVAAARYIRALYGYGRVRITYIGACPSADDPAIDARLTPAQFLGVLGTLGIVLREQPQVFDGVIPPDRRRHHSLPGGLPTAQFVAAEAPGRSLVELYAQEYKTDLAQRLLAGEGAFFDLAPRLGCFCSGSAPGVAAQSARAAVMALEPPRAPSPVIEQHVHIDVDGSVPPGTPHPHELGAMPLNPGAPPALAPAPAVAFRGTGEPASAARSEAAVATPTALDDPSHRFPLGTAARPGPSRVPLARASGGRVLPRAYAAWRRPLTAEADPSAAAALRASPPAKAEESAALERETTIARSIEPAPPVVEPSIDPRPPVMESRVEHEPHPVDSSDEPEPAVQSDPTPLPAPSVTPRDGLLPSPKLRPRSVPTRSALDRGRLLLIAATAVFGVFVAFLIYRSAVRGDINALQTLGTETANATTSGAPLDGNVSGLSLDSAPGIAIAGTLPPQPLRSVVPMPDSALTAAVASTFADSAQPSRRPVELDTVLLRSLSEDRRTDAARSNPRRSRGRRNAAGVPPLRETPASAAERAKRESVQVERDAIQRELQMRRARLDSIARRVESLPLPPRRQPR